MKTSKISQFLLIITLSIIAASCGNSLKVTTDFDRSVDFSKYKSFSLYSLKTTGSVSQLNADRIINSIKAEMIEKGYKYVESNGDLTINAITYLKDKQSISSTTNINGFGGMVRPYGGFGGMGMGMGGMGMGMATANTQYSTYDYKDGSLTIEVVDTQSAKMIWQAIGNKEIDKPFKDPDTAIRDKVKKIVAAYPIAIK
jgi:hypothetical protein